jgi:hypothetical protein
MKTRAALLLALGTASLTGCAALSLSRQPDPKVQLEQGVAALHAGDYTAAREHLEPVYREHWQEPVGQRALLTLIAAELDGRNPDRRLWAAAEMAARLLNIEQLETWMVPTAESLYLLAVELGAQEERLAQANSARAETEAAVAAARGLPASERETVPAQIRAIASERDALRRRVGELEQLAATRERELRETRQELERVKQAIRH